MNRVGVVGAGIAAAVHVRAWRDATNCAVAGVYDVRREVAERFAARLGLDRLFSGLDEMLDSCNVIDVCSPPPAHFPDLLEVVHAGQHLFVEKPIVIAVAEWDVLREELAASRSKLGVMHDQKFMQSVKRARNWLDEGRIGHPLRIDRTFLTDPTTDRMLAPTGHWSHALPGGRWFETLPHDLYITYHFLGPAQLEMVSVLRTVSKPVGVGADEVVIALKAERCITILHFSANCALNQRTMTIYGSTGVVRVDGLSDVASITKVRNAGLRRRIGVPFIDAGACLLRMPIDRVRYVRSRLAGDSSASRAITAFARYLDDRGPPPSTMQEIDYVVRTADRISCAIEARLRDET